jgi:glyceraldehyde 3-phosphate dehydrogenase
MPKKRIAINGFGRIGRAAFKIALEKQGLEVVAINDLTDPQNLAYLLKYDTVYGRYNKPVSAGKDYLLVKNKKIPVFAEPDPAKLPWKKLKVDTVLECTGFFTEKDGAAKHLKAGAKKVIISAPTKSDDLVTVVKGVNEEKANGQKIFSNASCTTNCASPVMAILETAFGIEKSLMSTIHAYTATQKIVDGPDKKDFLRGRAAAQNIVPSTTGAAKAVVKTLPTLKDKFDGISIRVPVACGSLTDFVCLLKKNVTEKEINQVFIKYSKMPRFKNILATSSDPIASSDIIGTTASAIVDLNYTRVVGGNLVKVLAWYDNEWAYSARLVEMSIV